MPLLLSIIWPRIQGTILLEQITELGKTWNIFFPIQLNNHLITAVAAAVWDQIVARVIERLSTEGAVVRAVLILGCIVEHLLRRSGGSETKLFEIIGSVVVSDSMAKLFKYLPRLNATQRTDIIVEGAKDWVDLSKTEDGQIMDMMLWGFFADQNHDRLNLLGNYIAAKPGEQ